MFSTSRALPPVLLCNFSLPMIYQCSSIDIRPYLLTVVQKSIMDVNIFLKFARYMIDAHIYRWMLHALSKSGMHDST